MKIRLAILALAMMAMTMLVACTFVRPQDAALFDTNAANSRAFSTAVQNDAAVPGYVKTWIKAEASIDTNTANWANGRQATPAASTQP